MIAPEELAALLEAYRDGSLEREDAERLAGELRAGGEAAGPVMDDVEFSSLLHRALDPTGGEELVREFFAGMGIGVLGRPEAVPAGAGAAAPAPAAGRARRLGVWAAAAAAVAAAAVGAWFLLKAGAEQAGPENPRLVRDGGRDRPAGVAPAGEVLAGAVEVRPRGAKEFAAVPVGGRLLPGDAVRAASSGPAEIDLLNKVKLVLDGGAELALAADPALPCGVRLERGQVFAEVAKGAPFRVSTSEGEVRSLGTKFAVGLFAPAGAAGSGGLAVSVEEGAVEVSAAGEVATVASGNCLVLERGCPWRREGGECLRRRLGWVEEWRGCGRGRGDGEGCGAGGGQRQGQGQGRGRGMHGGSRGGGAR